MQPLSGLIGLALTVLILGVFAFGMFRRSWDLVSWRNLFLLGYIHFYCLGAYFTSTGASGPAAFIRFPTGGWGTLIVCLVLFLALFLMSARFAIRRPFLGRWIPDLQIPVTGPAIVTCALTLSAAALLFSIPFANYFGLLVAQVRGQLSACAVGLATYYLIARRFNPISWSLFATVLFVALITSTVGTAGRRLLLSVLIAAPWMWYFTVWRYRAPMANLARVGVLVVLGILAIIIYSPFRAAGTGKDMSSSTLSQRTDQLLQIVSDPKIDTSIIKYILYTDTTGNTLWILENYPEIIPYDPFQGIKWFLANPIPRTLWPDKPVALGATMSQVLHVDVKNFSFGPGIIGHGWSEGAYFGVAAYAVAFGLLCGIIDRRLHDQSTNPFFIAAIGCTLGNVFALPRGDTPLFLIQITGGVVSCMFMLWVLRSLNWRFWGAFPPLLPAGAGLDEHGEPAVPEHDAADSDGLESLHPGDVQVSPSEQW